MPRLDPNIIRLRLTTIEIIEELQRKKGFTSERQAAMFFYNEVVSKNLNLMTQKDVELISTGFSLSLNFDEFYDALKKAKKSDYIREERKASENTDYPEDRITFPNLPQRKNNKSKH